MEKRISELLIEKGASLARALRQMDECGRKLLIVTENGRFSSLLSIGDIQRAVIRHNNLDLEVGAVLRPAVTVARPGDDRAELKKRMQARRNEFMPVIDAAGVIREVIFWEDLFTADSRPPGARHDLPVVIMAGGRGSRLRPLTNVFPKALIPLGEKTVLERIIDSFLALGCKRFYLSVNYKAEMIRYYLDQLERSEYSICCFQEERPLGTAGSLRLVADQLRESFFVSNCDVLVDQDYSEIIAYHRENDNDLTLVAAIKSISLPYGIVHSGENGLLAGIEEKPDLSLRVNTGLYLLEPGVLDFLPGEGPCDFNELIGTLQKQGRRVGVFPVSEKSWIDIGSWPEYIRNQK